MDLKLEKDALRFDIDCFDPQAFILMDYLYPDLTEDEAWEPLERLSSWITPKEVENYYRDNFNINLKFDTISYDPLQYPNEWELTFIASTGDVLYITPKNDQIEFYAHTK